MAELISKAAVLRLVFDSIGKPATAIYQKVRELPPADAVEVVRCRECAYWKNEDEEMHYSRRDEHLCYMTRYVTQADFYCADGDRKNGGKDTR